MTGRGKVRTTDRVRIRSLQRTHDSIPLQHRGTSVEHKDRLDPIEEEFTDSAKEAQNVCVNQSPTLLVTHGGLELVDPDTGVDSERLSLHGLQPFQVLSMSSNSDRKGGETAQYWPTQRSQQIPQRLNTHTKLQLEQWVERWKA